MEIICVGNELLIGKTLNTNAHWLAGKATEAGMNVRRITVVADEVSEIATAIIEAFERKPRFVVTTGGLGPTFDDKTLEGIARCFNRKLVVNQKALEMVRQKYESYDRHQPSPKIELTPARMKMATLPEGTDPLPNPVGTAPGMILQTDNTTLVALPGVPPEMQAIFNQSVILLLRKEAGGSGFYATSMYVAHMMESMLAPLIDGVMNDNPGVYIKSHVYTGSSPQTEGERSPIELHLSMTAENPQIAKECLERAAAQLRALIQKEGGHVKT